LKAILRLVIIGLVKIIAIALFASGALVLIAHFTAGERSPGISAITNLSLRFRAPLIFALCIIYYAFQATRILWLAKRQAAQGGLTLRKYFELSQEERESLVERLRASGTI